MNRKTASFAAGSVLAGLVLAWHDVGAQVPPFDENREIPTLAPLLKQVMPAVVNVAVVGSTTETRNPLLDDPFFRRFFEAPQPDVRPQPHQSVGSGVIVDAEQGLIVTNQHVVRDAERIVVTTSDRRQFDATVVGSDEGTDVALLRIDARGTALSEIAFGDSDTIEVGDYVVAIGNPFGLGQTATTGIVSAVGRSGVNIERYEDFIQTDASINPGNSGGALVGLDGKLIGINTAILSGSGGNIGIGFAIPSNMVRQVVDQLLEYGEVRRGRLGIGIQDVTPSLAEALDLGVEQGALVTQVDPGSPAERADIETGDIVTAVNGEPVQGSSDLRNEIGLIRIGETVSLTILRDGTTRTVRATVGEAPRQAAAGTGRGGEPAGLAALDGAELIDLTPNHPLYAGTPGVLVAALQPGSSGWRSGLAANDVITAVNRQRVTSVAELSAAIAQAERPLALQVQRDGRALFLVLQ